MRQVQYADRLETASPPAPRRRKRPPSSRFSIEVVTTSGRAAAVEFRIQHDTVEVWHHAQRSGVVERDCLRDWLTEPDVPLVINDVELSVDRMVDARGRVALSLHDVSLWTLSPHALDGLRARL